MLIDWFVDWLKESITKRNNYNETGKNKKWLENMGFNFIPFNLDEKSEALCIF